MIEALLIGAGAIGTAVLRALEGEASIRVRWVLVRPSRKEEFQRALGERVAVIGALEELDAEPAFALECAGHQAVRQHLPELLRRGVDCALVSVGALAEPGLPEALEAAAAAGGARLEILAGAIAGIDALAAARIGGLEEVIYTGRKPPLGWSGTPAERAVDLRFLEEATTIFEGSAREAARLYPKNANVAAAIALAGLGLERTRARLVADPKIARNIHQVSARGAFGELQLAIAGKPLPDNPKTSALAAWSAVRALRNRAARLAI